MLLFLSIFSFKILTPILLLVSVFIIYLVLKFQKLKIAENKKLSFLYIQLEKEKKISIKLSRIPKDIKLIEKKTQQNIQMVKVGILNIDFSLSEIVR